MNIIIGHALKSKLSWQGTEKGLAAPVQKGKNSIMYQGAVLDFNEQKIKYHQGRYNASFSINQKKKYNGKKHL